MKIELTEDQVWTLVETLESWAETVEHLGDEEYIKKLNDLEASLRGHLPEFTNGKIKE